MTLINMLNASVVRNPEALAIVDGDKRLNYAQWFDEISLLAGGLNKLGLKPRDHFVVVLCNRMEMASLYWASQMLGLIFTPFNWRATGSEIEYILVDAEAKAIAYEARSELAVLDAIKGNPEFEERLICLDAGMRGFPFSDLLKQGKFHNYQCTDDRLSCLMLYTSGTTGRPKGVPRSHAAEIAASLGCIAQLRYRSNQVNLGVMPLFHTMGVRTLLMSVFLNGTFVCMPTYNVKKLLALVRSEKINTLFLVPTMFHDIVHSDVSDLDVATVDNIAYAGMSMTTHLVDRCSKLFTDSLFSNFYGSSEIYTFAVRNNLAENPSSAGWAGIGQVLKIVRADAGELVNPDDEVPIGDTGEIVASMQSLDAFEGYWKRPDADKKAIRDGWYFTGDLGRFDEKGEIYVLGRVDDMIISGGENIYAEEVENILASSPDVHGVAVIGTSDDRWGERVTAYIEPKTLEASAEVLDNFCLNSELARFKRPRAYAFVDQIPKSASGKLLRRKLREGNYNLLSEYKSTI
ncbi:MAG: 4-chlorobenzoate--CoA ligase [Rhodospirillaceae bacterium]|nr:4-chlorobenzoate--CoA ligase [Rhodospirillaceae bacterium]